MSKILNKPLISIVGCSNCCLTVVLCPLCEEQLIDVSLVDIFHVGECPGCGNVLDEVCPECIE